MMMSWYPVLQSLCFNFLWTRRFSNNPSKKFLIFETSRFSVIERYICWSNSHASPIHISRFMVLQGFDLNSPCPSQVPTKSPKFFSSNILRLHVISSSKILQSQSSNSHISDSSCLRVPLFLKILKLVFWLLSSLVKIVNFQKISYITNLQVFEREENISIDGRTFRSIWLLVPEVLSFLRHLIEHMEIFQWEESYKNLEKAQGVFNHAPKLQLFSFKKFFESGCTYWLNLDTCKKSRVTFWEYLPKFDLEKFLNFFLDEKLPLKFPPIEKKSILSTGGKTSKFCSF